MSEQRGALDCAFWLFVARQNGRYQPGLSRHSHQKEGKQTVLDA